MGLPESTQQQTTGIILGRFLPPHEGHRFLIDYANCLVDELTIFLCSLPDEPISGETRLDWMQELFPKCRIIHFSQALPEAGRENPQAPLIWAQYITPHMQSGIDFVFASEDYGKPLADALNAQFIPVDLGRNSVPVSGRQIRENPFQHWNRLPHPVRAHFVKRIGIICRTARELKAVDTAAEQLETLVVALPEDTIKADALLYAASRQAFRYLIVILSPSQKDEIVFHRTIESFDSIIDMQDLTDLSAAAILHHIGATFLIDNN